MHDSLPAELKASGPISAATWDKWVRSQDQQIRVRVEEGEENTLTNLLRLGVTYTTQPRIGYQELERYGHNSSVDAVASKRADDLVRALAGPHPSPGMREMRQFVEKKGFDLKTPAGQQKTKAYLLANLARLRDDVIKGRQQAQTNRFQAFKDRGISTDSNLYPDYMIDLHLRNMMKNGLLQPASVSRIAIIGPGLDFVNKKSGADFYPPQTTQPFAVVDSLLRLKLAKSSSMEVYTFDISSRVNRHIEQIRKAAVAGKGYTIQLLSSPSDEWDVTYHTGFLEYWEKLGSQVGKPTTAIPVPERVEGVWNRAVYIRPEVVRELTPVDMDAVYQILALPPNKQFDLVIATNIFVYYGSFEQAVARANIATMVKPGGFLLTNERLPNAAPSALTDSLTTSATVSRGATDYMFSYARQK